MNDVTKSYCPINVSLECHSRGYVLADVWEFFDDDTGAPFDVSSDDFEMRIKNASGIVIETLTIGSGLEYAAANYGVVFQISTAVTGTSGTYTFDLDWTRSGVSYPVLAITGTIEVV